MLPEAGFVFDLEGGALGEDVERQAAHVERVVILPPRDARRHEQAGVVFVAQADPEHFPSVIICDRGRSNFTRPKNSVIHFQAQILLEKVLTLTTYTVWRPLGHDVLFCFLSEVPVTNWAAQ